MIYNTKGGETNWKLYENRIMYTSMLEPKVKKTKKQYFKLTVNSQGHAANG